MKTLAAALAVLLAQIPAVPLGAEEPLAWRAVDAATGTIADVAGLEQLARDFPDSTNVRLRLFNAQLEAGDGEGRSPVSRGCGSAVMSSASARRRRSRS